MRRLRSEERGERAATSEASEERGARRTRSSARGEARSEERGERGATSEGRGSLARATQRPAPAAQRPAPATRARRATYPILSQGAHERITHGCFSHMRPPQKTQGESTRRLRMFVPGHFAQRVRLNTVVGGGRVSTHQYVRNYRQHVAQLVLSAHAKKKGRTVTAYEILHHCKTTRPCGKGSAKNIRFFDPYSGWFHRAAGVLMLPEIVGQYVGVDASPELEAPALCSPATCRRQQVLGNRRVAKGPARSPKIFRGVHPGTGIPGLAGASRLHVATILQMDQPEQRTASEWHDARIAIVGI